MASECDSFKPFEFDSTLKLLSDSSTLKAVPSKFNLTNDRTAFTSDSLPTIDFSALVGCDPHQRSKAVHHLATACQDWGFFILVNHGVPERLMSEMFREMVEFFSLADSEKKQYEAKSASDPIKCGNFNVANTSNQSFTLWREYLKLYEYTQMIRVLTRKLIEAVCEALELNQRRYPDQAIGIPPHTDHGLFTFLIHNGVAGLQIEHDGKWFNADSPKNSILVNAADQLEIFTNGRCKSVKHRAVVNEEKDRISIVVANGPSGEAVIGPAAALVEKDGRAKYRAMKYEEYVESQLTKSRIGGKSILEQQIIFPAN
ncbi:hypothetical protein SASPL_115457 [Salvia splendens]|uniref:Fe2OG dioxygenase domain-containing protein n=1 Tax=Salvia splendens TaxID=180675 RepID=A0A8X8Y5J4_SALSN|nr:hypothetical protein SASPL_115457 [Salvia splendens]